MDATEATTAFHQMLSDLQSTSADPKSVRKAACCAALVETAKESRAKKTSSEEAEAEVKPNELFIATLAALSSLQSSLEAKQKKSADTTTTAEDEEQITIITSELLENTALPLLEILRRIVPFVAHYSNNRGALLAHQFGTVSRLVRMFVALGYSLPSTSSGISSSTDTGSRKRKGKQQQQQQQGGAGANALLRQLLKLSTTLLLVLPPSNKIEKEAAKLLHATIVPMFHDARPKVRKAAWGCGMEIIIVASSSSSGNSTTSFAADNLQENTQLMNNVSSHRNNIADFLWEYCLAVLSSTKPAGGNKNNKETSSKVIHVLRFLSTALPFADDERIRIKFGEGCLGLMENKQQHKKQGSGGGGEVSLEVVKETLVTLLACLELTEGELMGEETADGGMIMASSGSSSSTSASSGGDGEMLSKFAARTLAFLLQHRPNTSNSSYGGGDVSVIYGRCLLACMERMLGKGNNDLSLLNNEVPASKLLAMKLLPNVLTSMLHLCDAPGDESGGDGGSGGANGESCGSEFNRFVSRMIPVVVSYLGSGGANAKLHRVSLEILPQCVPILQQALQIKYRNAWGSILSGGYATFISTLSTCLLETKQAAGVLEGNLQEWIKTLIASLLRLHNDVEKDGTARTAVEYATSTIIRGTGVELFLTVVDFVDDDDTPDHDGKKKKKSSSTGGGIRDDRAWLLPLMKQSTSSSEGGSSSSSDVAITSKSNLSFFQGRVLNLARKCDAASVDGHRTAAEVSIQKARVVELWSLFPAFCVRPLDMKDNFATVAKTVVKALGDHGRYPKLIVSSNLYTGGFDKPIVCSISLFLDLFSVRSQLFVVVSKISLLVSVNEHHLNWPPWMQRKIMKYYLMFQRRSYRPYSSWLKPSILTLSRPREVMTPWMLRSLRQRRSKQRINRTCNSWRLSLMPLVS